MVKQYLKFSWHEDEVGAPVDPELEARRCHSQGRHVRLHHHLLRGVGFSGGLTRRGGMSLGLTPPFGGVGDFDLLGRHVRLHHHLLGVGQGVSVGVGVDVDVGVGVSQSAAGVCPGTSRRRPIWARQFGQPMLFSAAKLTSLYRKPRMTP